MKFKTVYDVFGSVWIRTRNTEQGNVHVYLSLLSKCVGLINCLLGSCRHRLDLNDQFFLLSTFLKKIFGGVEAIKLTEYKVWRLEGDLTEMELLQ